MAKQRKSAFNSPKAPSKQEVKEEAKAIEEKALTGRASSNKRKHLYVDEKHHAAAKLAAITRRMSLQQYIESLIAADTM